MLKILQTTDDLTESTKPVRGVKYNAVRTTLVKSLFKWPEKGILLGEGAHSFNSLFLSMKTCQCALHSM